MTAYQLAALILSAVGVGVGFALIYWRFVRVETRHRVLVTLDTGDTFEGLLVRRLPDRLILEAARLHRDGAETSVDGTVELDRSRITWVQVP